MQIDPNSWHCKLYMWWYTHKYAQEIEIERTRTQYSRFYFDSETSDYLDKTNSNLCPYMRTVLIWAPMRGLLWSWIKVGKVPLNAITIPAMVLSIPAIVYHWNHHVAIRLLIAYGVIIGIGVTTALLTGAVLFTANHSQQIARGLDYLVLPVGRRLRKVNTKPFVSFAGLIRAFIRAAHDRVCPEVNWRKK